jgi:hypothetical protein
MSLRSPQAHQDPPRDALDTEIAQLANRLFVLYEEKAEVAQRASRATQLTNDALHATEIEAELGDVRFKLSELQLVAYRRDRSKGSGLPMQAGVSALPTYQLRPNQRSRRSARSEYAVIKRLEATAGIDGIRAARQRVNQYRTACRKLEVWRELSAEAVSQVYLEALEEIVRDGIEPVIDCRDDLRERREFAQYQSPHRLNWADE